MYIDQIIFQDDTYTESYISTIGVDFVSDHEWESHWNVSFSRKFEQLILKEKQSNCKL